MNLTELTTERLFGLIKKSKDAVPEKSGLTPLIIISEQISSLLPEEKMYFEKVTAGLSHFFDNLSSADFSQLGSFIYNSKFLGSKIIRDQYYEWYSNHNDSDNELIAKKFQILQIISLLGFQIGKEEVFLDEYKENYFWQWILLLVNNGNIEDGIPALLERIRNYRHEFSLIMKILPTLQKRLNENQFRNIVSEAYDNILDRSNQQILKSWCEKRNIELINHINSGDVCFLAGARF